MRRLLFALLLSLSALAEDATFLIRSVEVRGAQVPAGIIRAETRLRPGASYSEADVAQAVARIRRLPFVHSVEYGLSPNAEDRSYTLVISIVTTTRIDTKIAATGATGGRNESGGHRDTGNADAFVRGRQFLGNGMLDGGLRGIASSDATGRDVNLTYTAYGLFGTSVFASATLSQKFGSVREPLLPSLTIGVPLTRVQTLLAAAGRTADHEKFQGVVIGPETTYALLLWSRDTTNDPYLPISGTYLAAGPRFSSYRFRASDFRPGSQPFEIDGSGRELRASAAHYLPLGESGTVWGKLDVIDNDVELEFPGLAQGTKTTSADASVGLAYNRARDDNPFGIWRFELGATYHRFDLKRDFSPTSTVNEPGVMAAMQYRGRWTLIRLAWVHYFSR